MDCGDWTRFRTPSERLMRFACVFLILLGIYAEGMAQRSHDHMLYRKFVFSDHTETGILLARVKTAGRLDFTPEWLDNEELELSDFIVEREEKRTRYILIDSVMVLGADSDSALLGKQLLLAIEAYNLWSGTSKEKRGNNDSLSTSLFFKEPQALHDFTFDHTEAGVDYGSIEVRNLRDVDVFNFKHTVEAECDDATCRILFLPSALQLICSRQCYDSILFPKYLNSISKDHRLTPYQIGVEKR